MALPHVTGLAGMACVVAALLFQVISVATPGWIKAEGLGGSVTEGLWKTCETVGSATDCQDLPGDVKAWFQAVRAFSLLGVFSMATCVGLFVLTVVKSDVIILGSLTALAAVGGALCSLIAFAVYAGKTRDSVKVAGVSYDYSFFLTVIACLLSIAAAILFGVAARRRAGYANL